jgi:iron(III) transport system substrate-binding protein
MPQFGGDIDMQKSDVKKCLVTVALACLSMISAPVSAELSKPGEPITINWYHWVDALKPVIDAYMQDTGRKVKVTNDYDTFTTDVVMVSDYKGLLEGKKFKHFQKLNSPLVDEVVPARWRDREGYWVGC